MNLETQRTVIGRLAHDLEATEVAMGRKRGERGGTEVIVQGALLVVGVPGDTSSSQAFPIRVQEVLLERHGITWPKCPRHGGHRLGYDRAIFG